MQESEFEALAAAFLSEIFEEIEQRDVGGAYDAEETHGNVNIEHEDSGKTWVVSKNSAAQEIWLASPISGGLHYGCDADSLLQLKSLLFKELGL